MASTIGIKIANGEFYSLVEENSSVKKRLILTTVHDSQRSVQIDLYRSAAKTMMDAVYIGSLVVEKIKARPKGDPSIEMMISSAEDGNISAEAIDLDSGPRGEHQYLNVSLKSLDDDNREYDIPDFEVEQNDGPPSGLYEKSLAVKAKEPSGFPVAAIIAAVVVGLLILILGIWYFLFWGKNGKAGPEAEPRSVSQNEAPQAEPQKPIEPPAAAPVTEEEVLPSSESVRPVEEAPPVIEAPKEAPPEPASRVRREAPVSSYKVPAVIPREGAVYRIRWGDTLWDISEAFYRNPWLYPRIARFNNIRNPDRIISGRTIRVPPRN